jgi:hypothetical protein
MASKGRTSSTKAGGGKKSSSGGSSSGGSSSGGSSSGGSSSGGSSSGGSSSGGSSSGSSGRRYSPAPKPQPPRPKPTITSVTPPTTVTSTTHTNNGISTNKTVPSANPNSKTQAGGRGSSVFSQSQKAVSQQSTSKAQKETFTYATTKSGNTFVIPSNLNAQARQYYAKLGVATSSQPPTEASFAVDSDTQVIIDHIELANWIDDNQVTQDMETQQEIGTDVQPITPDENIFTDNSIPKGDESTANAVQSVANTNGTTNTVVAEADANWAMGQNLYTGYSQDSLAILDGSANKQDSNGQQWMTQQNQNVVPRDTYVPMAQNGANGTTAMVDNFKASFEKITSNKYFPFIVLGFVGLIVLSVLRGGKSSGGGGAPPVQITRYG